MPKNPFDNDIRNEQSKDDVVQQMLKDLTLHLSRALPSNWGFALYMIEYGGKEDDKDIYFASTIDKANVVQFMRQWVEKNAAN